MATKIFKKARRTASSFPAGVRFCVGISGNKENPFSPTLAECKSFFAKDLVPLHVLSEDEELEVGSEEPNTDEEVDEEREEEIEIELNDEDDNEVDDEGEKEEVCESADVDIGLVGENTLRVILCPLKEPCSCVTADPVVVPRASAEP